MNKPKNHIQVIELWGEKTPYKGLADDMCNKATSNSDRANMHDRARKWYQRGVIACDCFPLVVHAAKKRGFDIDLDLLHKSR